MKLKRVLVILLILSSTLVFSTNVLATPGASILYNETDLSGGWWKYDYTFNNTSTDESLYSLRLNFGGFYAIASPTLPVGWKGSWALSSPTSFLETHTANASYNIAPSGTESGFSFKINSRIGTPFTAYVKNDQGDISIFTGTTAVAPEPLSAILFLTGGATLAVSRYARRRKKN